MNGFKQTLKLDKEDNIMFSRLRKGSVVVLVLGLVMIMMISTAFAYRPNTYKPRLMGKEWVAITGEPLSATAGAKIFLKGGNAVDASCAMLAATCVMNDSLSFGGENQMLIYNPNDKKVYGINGLGVAPTGATPDYFMEQGMAFPPGYGPLAAVTPGTPGSLMITLAEFGTMSLKEVLEPAIDLADGYPLEPQTAAIYAEDKEQFLEWKYSKEVFLPGGEAPKTGEIFKQEWLADTLRKLVEAEENALKAGKSRKDAIMAAYDRFYKGDIAEEFVRGSQEGGGLHTMEDMANWKHYIEEPLMTTYKGIDVYKLKPWVQSPVLLQMLNILEPIDLKSMGHNSAKYIHTIYQAMNLAYADRDFYYGDPYFPPEEPMEGLLSKEYAAERRKLIDPEKNDPAIGPGDPYPFQGEENPFKDLLEKHYQEYILKKEEKTTSISDEENALGFGEMFGTTSSQAADAEGWVVSCTPSGGWPPAYIAGKTGVGMSQRMQSFVLDEIMNPYNLLEPGKRPRATLTPSLALKDGQPYLSFCLPGGDLQDQALLQFFLNVVEFGMDAQESAEAPKFESRQMMGSFGSHPRNPGRLTVDARIPKEVVEELKTIGYDVQVYEANVNGEFSGAITAIQFDQKNKTFMGAAGIPATSWGGPRHGISW